MHHHPAEFCDRDHFSKLLPTTCVSLSVHSLRVFLDFFSYVESFCGLTYLEHRPLLCIKGQLCRLILFRTLPAGLRRTNLLPLLHRLRPNQQLYLTDLIVKCPGYASTASSAAASPPTTNLLFEFTPSAALEFCIDALTIRSTEVSFQHHHHPQLNHPWINSLLRRYGLQRPQYSVPTTRAGPIGITTLHRHQRRRELHHAQECLLDLHLLRASDVLRLLHRLGSDTKEKFDTSQTVRSHAASPDVLYLLWSQHFHTQ